MLVKYPRTPHLPWSPGVSSDDINWTDDSHMQGIEVVVTEKMDGENTTMYKDAIHARSLDMAYHPSRTWIKNYHAQMSYLIPEGFRVCGENLYAAHSIEYRDLPSYFMVHSIWITPNVTDLCLSWDRTVDWARGLNLPTVPVLYEGVYDRDAIKTLTIDTQTQEGYVVRPRRAFKAEEFQTYVAKWVRADHVDEDRFGHWTARATTPNSLRG
jgi:hypothetical protein